MCGSTLTFTDSACQRPLCWLSRALVPRWLISLLQAKYENDSLR